MQERKQQLLKLIIENYIKTAEPVGSSFLVSEAGLKVSAPTVRNEMRELEEEGFLTHPHTSAGRIPTEQGYQLYVEELMDNKKIKIKVEEDVKKILNQPQEQIYKIKQVARYVSEQVNNAVIIGFTPDSVYYTGISNLFSQSEFRDASNLIQVSSIFDHCEDRMDDLFSAIGDEIDILVGQKNPFGNACGLVATKLDGKLFAIVGPMRMDYETGVGLLKIIKNL